MLNFTVELILLGLCYKHWGFALIPVLHTLLAAYKRVNSEWEALMHLKIALVCTQAPVSVFAAVVLLFVG